MSKINVLDPLMKKVSNNAVIFVDIANGQIMFSILTRKYSEASGIIMKEYAQHISEI